MPDRETSSAGGLGRAVLVLGSSALLLWSLPIGAQRRQNAHLELFIPSALTVMDLRLNYCYRKCDNSG